MQFGCVPNPNGPLERKLRAQVVESSRTERIRLELAAERAKLQQIRQELEFKRQDIETERRALDSERQRFEAERQTWREGEILSPEQLDRRDVEFARLVRAKVARQHKLLIHDLDGGSHTKVVSRVRHEAIYAIAAGTGLSFVRIGRMFGGRDHTSILHAVRQHALRNNLPLPRGMTPEIARAR